jgi:hypothetical protein
MYDVWPIMMTVPLLIYTEECNTRGGSNYTSALVEKWHYVQFVIYFVLLLIMLNSLIYYLYLILLSPLSDTGSFVISLERYRFYCYLPWAIQVLFLSPPEWYRFYFYIPWAINLYCYLPWAILYLTLLSPLSDTLSYIVISLERYFILYCYLPWAIQVLLLSPLNDTGSFVISPEQYRFIINYEPVIANVLL